MRYFFLLLLFLSFPSIAQNEEDDTVVEPNYRVHCDCEHLAETLQGEKDETLDACIILLGDLIETDLGSVRMPYNEDENSVACIFSHSVYGFGEDRDSAIENAKTTCAAVAVQTSREFNIPAPDECKDQQ